MAPDWGYPPLPDPGGGGTSNYLDGSYTGATLPSHMDPYGLHGELIVLKLQPALENGQLPDNPFMIRSSIEGWIKGKIDGAIPEAWGKTYALKVRSKWQMERLLTMNKLEDGTEVKIMKHANLNSVRCVINCQAIVKLNDDDVLSYLKEQKVTSIRRITRRTGSGNDREPTATIILTIDGTRAPEHIDVGYLRCKTRPFYPAPMLCYQCYTFGYTKQRCQQPTPTCGHCAQKHAIENDVRCQAAAFCPRCETNLHSISSRSCPVFKKRRCHTANPSRQGNLLPRGKAYF